MLHESIEVENVLTAGQQNQDTDNTTEHNHNSSVSEDESSIETAAPESSSATPPPSVSPAEGGGVRDFPEDLPPWDDPVDMDCIADQMRALISKHCVLTEPEKVAITLWAIASYEIDTFRIFPKLSLISPEKRCGKTTTLETLMALCKNAVISANTSAAVIYRLTSLGKPTLMIDEADTFVKGGDPSLIGIINSGHTKAGAHVLRCEGENYNARAYSTWMPMVLASIGDLPHTIMDRSIVINLRRKTANEHVARIPPDLDSQCVDLRRQVERWRADTNSDILRTELEPPELGNDRARDNWTPLFAIAKNISSKWLEACHVAYKALTVTQEPEIQTQLLQDIRTVFSQRELDRIRTSDLIEELTSDPDSGWTNVAGGWRLTPKVVSNLLAPYKIKPAVMRIDGGTYRGYNRLDFADAFDRYLN